MEPFDLIAENHAHHRAMLPRGVDAAALPVPVMRTVFVADDRAQAEDALAAHARESRMPRGGRLPRALARAASAPPEQRVVIGELAEVIDRLAHWRDALRLDLLIVRPQVAGVDERARRRSFDRIVGDVAPALAASTPGARAAPGLSRPSGV